MRQRSPPIAGVRCQRPARSRARHRAGRVRAERLGHMGDHTAADAESADVESADVESAEAESAEAESAEAESAEAETAGATVDGDTERGGIGRTGIDRTRCNVILATQHPTRVDKRGKSQPNKSRATTGGAIAAKSMRRQEATSREPTQGAEGREKKRKWKRPRSGS